MIDRNLRRFGETFLGVGPDARNRFFMRISAAFALRRLQLPERDQPLGGDQGRVGSACSSSPESVTMPPRLEGAGAAPTPEPIGQVGELQVEQHQHLIDGLDAGGPRYMPAPQRAVGRAGATAGVPLCVEIMGVLVPRSRAMAEGEAKPTLLPLAAEMTPSQREAYERECLEELQHRVERVQPSAHRFHLVRAVRLEGRYPETAIRVEWLDTRNDRERERRFLLWINPVTRKPPGSFEYGPEGKLVGREVPEQVAMLIQVWVEEN